MKWVFVLAIISLAVTSTLASDKLFSKLTGEALEYCNNVSSGRQEDSGIDVFFVFTRADFPVEQRAQLKAFRRAERRQMVHDWFVAAASQSQSELLSFLKQKNLKPRSFWINNSVFIRKATASLIFEVLERFDIERVVANSPVASVLPMNSKLEKGRLSQANEWNIEKIRAPDAWNVTRGEGIVVGIIDTGVRYTHEALRANYRGSEDNHDYAWFDPGEFANDPWWCTPGICSPEECCADYPYDIIGHGSHVCGSSVGALGLGVAPGATWIAAKGCRDGQCLNYGLTTSAEWMLCPTKLDGTSPDCSKGADIVSNSWGGSSTDTFYFDYVDAWRLAGMIPVFANGNSGPRCSTSNAPGNYDNVLGIGATTDNDQLASYSSRGPGPNQNGFANQKPDLVAPGDDIRSCSGSSDNGYSVSSGTSMATPHVSGVIALMLAVNPRLEYEDIYQILARSSVTALGDPLGWNDNNCGIPYNEYPNYAYGYGRVDAYNAINTVLSFKNEK